MKIATAIIILVSLAIIGFSSFFFLLLALNGFSERDTTASLIIHTIWVVVCAIVMSFAGYFATKFLIGKSLNAVLSMIISIVLFVGLGAIINFGGIIVSAIVASEVRQYNMKK